ncbi:FecR family protein [Daejeonella oryzae]|uniref:FecR family protein n=1 Tax=Daejeonella oryzae TaxID=1122943 RepID=UPI0004083784|nr:FecR domain-containing protein [Daejeonella oryzae]
MNRKHKSDRERVDAAWNKLEPLLEDRDILPVRSVRYKHLVAAAAILLFLSIGGAVFMNNYFKEVSYTTQYGQTQTLFLPDSSEVTLNGNSTLSYRKSGFGSGDRSVTLKGEAYFSVRHTKSDQKFFVKTANRSSVEVLGTEFNVFTRGEGTKVILNSGKIRFTPDEQKDNKDESFIMKPGDLIEYKSNTNMLIKKVVDPQVHSSWRTSRLIFDKTSLREIAQIINDTYGLHVKTQDPQLLNMKVSGSAPTQNIDMLIKGLSEIFDLELIKKGDTLIISSKHLHY